LTNDANNVSLKEMLLSLLAEHQHAHVQQHAASERALDAAFAAQVASVSSAFAAQKAAIDTALAASDRANAAVNEAQDRRLDGLKEHVATIQAIRASAHDEAHAADARAIAAALQAQKDANVAALSASKEAVIVAAAAIERRLEGVNEFRAQLADYQRTLLPRAEHDSELRAMRDQLAALTTRLDRGEGRGTGLQAGWGYLVTGIGLFLTLLTIGGVLFAVTR